LNWRPLQREKNSQFNDKTAMLTFGIRSSFRAIYNDLVSYKTIDDIPDVELSDLR
jgi:hypothetical protein